MYNIHKIAFLLKACHLTYEKDKVKSDLNFESAEVLVAQTNKRETP